ncbi:hypothetical protein TanjilG_25663 [Lupinus angustifolius]|uniref:Uncharacterized protein n=1 Tax=Lupinus angustifolius TaxID=3871 RepID=A0A1J7G1W8_LUPAN|nr:hypothetical protein TanjilG_25663 [Lupinus angustifolius]
MVHKSTHMDNSLVVENGGNNPWQVLQHSATMGILDNKPHHVHVPDLRDT